MIYLDYAATTPVDPQVAEVIYDALKNTFANPSSIYQSGKHNKYLLMQARKQLGQLLKVKDSEIFFTSGATEANNWAIKAQAFQSKQSTGKNHIVATAIEHPSVRETLRYLEEQGFEVTYLNPQDGIYRAQQFLQASNSQTIGWVAMWVNNELGSILPIEELGQAAKENNYWFHVDAVQKFASGKITLDQVQATSISASAHKVYGPKGIGFLVFRPWDKTSKIVPLIHGGGQEAKKRSGTENLPYILGLVKAFELIEAKAEEKYRELEQYFLRLLKAKGFNFQRNGYHHVPYIISLYFPEILASHLLIQLDLSNIAISAGSACSAGSLEKSHVLEAYYPGDLDVANRSIRISFGKETTKETIDQFVEKLEKILRKE